MLVWLLKSSVFPLCFFDIECKTTGAQAEFSDQLHMIRSRSRVRPFGFAHIVNVIEARNSSLCRLLYVCTPSPQANRFKHFKRTWDGRTDPNSPVWKGSKSKSMAFPYSTQGIASLSCPLFV